MGIVAAVSPHISQEFFEIYGPGVGGRMLTKQDVPGEGSR